jgi:TonB-linked SusC/RagA family outer membrane protein
MSGGSQNSKFYASLGYFDQDGIVMKNWYKRYSGRFNSEFKIADRVTIGENINIVHRSDHGTDRNGQEGSAVALGAYRTQPIIPNIWTEADYAGLSHNFTAGDWGGTGIAPRLGNGSNYVADQTRGEDNTWQELRVFGNVFADVKIIEGLNFRTSFGGFMSNTYYRGWSGKTYENSENTATSSYGNSANYRGEWTWTNTLTFARQMGEHNLLAVLGYEAGKYGMGRDVGANKADYFSESLAYRTVSNGATLVNGYGGYSTPRTLVSQFLRADYNFRNKYYVSGTVRRDGSSVFGPETRYGVFPSASAGWRISEESFLAGASFISDLKIRGGYGTMGNQLAVSTANQFYLYAGSAANSYYDINGTTGSSKLGFYPSRIGNPDAQWETSVNANIGFDAVLLNRTLEINFDWYMKDSRDLLFTPELPGTAGDASAPAVNIGEMHNTGIDLQLIYHQNWGDFSFEANLTFTSYTNEIVAISPGYDYFDSGGSRIGSFNRNMVGYPMGQFWGYNVTGIFQSQGEVDGAATQDGATAGTFRYEDADGSGAIDPDDRQFIGNPNPDFTYGINLVLGYKGFDLTAFFYGSQGAEIFDYNLWWLDFWPSFQGQKSTDLLYNSWSPSNTSGTTPMASNQSNFSTNTVSNSYYVQDGSFFRLKNLQIGYTFDKAMLGNTFANARVYLQATNLFTITSYSGLDPELASFDDRFTGVDEGNLPAIQQYLIGVSFGF